jgi:hypothetical protein
MLYQTKNLTTCSFYNINFFFFTKNLLWVFICSCHNLELHFKNYVDNMHVQSSVLKLSIGLFKLNI